MKKTTERTKKRDSDIWDLIPIILLLIMVPLFVMGTKKDVSTLASFPWFPAEEFQLDFFAYGKSICILIITVWLMLLLIDKIVIRNEKLRLDKTWILLIVVGIGTVLSSVFSVNRTLSLKGMWEQYESLWIILGYGVIIFTVSQIVRSEKEAKILLTALCVGAALQALLGVMQMCNMDFFSSEIGKDLLTMNIGQEFRDSLVFQFENNSRNTVYMALFNPNYAAMYLVMVIPVTFYVFSIVEAVWKKAAVGILSIVLVVCLYGTGTKTGLIVLGFILIMEVYWLARKKRKQKIFFIGAILIFFILCITDISMGFKIGKSLNRSFRKNVFSMEEMNCQGNQVWFQWVGKKVIFSVTEDSEGVKLYVKDEQGIDYPVLENQETGKYYVDEADLREIYFSLILQENQPIILISHNEKDWCFIKRADTGEFTFLNALGRTDRMITAANVWKYHDRAFSGRGFLWGRTIPLLKDYIFIGSGPDTFTVVFPQNDYLGRLLTSKTMFEQIITKPHSLYLQMALQLGAVSAICFILFVGCYIVRTLVVMKRCFLKSGLIFTILCSVTAYLLMGALNDSTVQVTPVFVVLLGIGISLEKTINNEN